jgi:hypothetical protein
VKYRFSSKKKEDLKMKPETEKAIKNLGSKQFAAYVQSNSKPIKNLLDTGTVSVKEAIKLFAKIQRPIPYHVDKLTCTITLRELGLYGTVTLFRTRYGQTMRYDSIAEDACFKKASVTIGRSESNKVYFETFRNVNGEWRFGLSDAKRAFAIHEDHQAFTAKEMQLVLDALTRMNHLAKNDSIFNGKYPTAANITL